MKKNNWGLALLVTTAVLVGYFLIPRGLSTGRTLAANDAPQIAFIVYQPGPYGELFVFDHTTGSIIKLTQTGNRIQSATWSPNGRYIAFYYVPRDGNTEIYRLDVTSGDLLRLTPEGSPDCFWPTWSPDGTKLACYNGDPVNGEIFLVNTDGTGFSSLTIGSQPSWSSDGARLIYMLDQDPSDSSIGPDIMAIDIESGAISILAELEGAEQYPRWSPDETMIAFVKDQNDQEAGLYDTLNIWDGNSTTLVSKTLYRDYSFGWSPDGTKLRYLTCEYDIASSESNCRRFESISYSPDGSQFAYVDNNEICLIPQLTDTDCFRIPKGIVKLIGWRNLYR